MGEFLVRAKCIDDQAPGVVGVTKRRIQVEAKRNGSAEIYAPISPKIPLGCFIP
jgi:hypothetical protein